MIGTTPVQIVQMIPVGSQIRRFTTHVQQVGVFQMEEKMVCGRKPLVHLHYIPEHTTAPTRVWTFPASSVLLPPFGILLRPIATPTMAVSAALATTAIICPAHRIRVITVQHSTSVSGPMVTLIRQITIAFERMGMGSVVSRNKMRDPRSSRGWL